MVNFEAVDDLLACTKGPQDVLEVGGHVVKANFTNLGTLVLPFYELLQTAILHHFAYKQNLSRPYILNYKQALR